MQTDFGQLSKTYGALLPLQMALPDQQPAAEIVACGLHAVAGC
jgi:hypothetical protein